MTRPIRIEGDVAFVSLTRGHEAMIDAEDVPFVEPYTWTALVSAGRAYAVTTIDLKTVYMRRLLARPAPGRRVRQTADPLDCRKATLGIVGKLADVKPQRQRKWPSRYSPKSPRKIVLPPFVPHKWA